MRYNNYHKHDHKGNYRSLDVIVKLEEYCKRAIELGHTTVFTTNHGTTGDVYEALTLAEKYNLKMIVGAEAYYVKDRTLKEGRGKHLIIIAKNNEGVQQLNNIMSEAELTGWYYKPRIDDELLFSLSPHNFIITTACIAGIWEDTSLILRLYEYFKDNFYLEVQNHNVNDQKYVNATILKLHKQYEIKIIHANDSHYIYPEDSKYRDLYLKGKRDKVDENGEINDIEQEFILDYPSSDDIINRYLIQGVLSQDEIQDALSNTLIFDECEPITYINTKIKLPSVSKHPVKELNELIVKAWHEEKKNIDPKFHRKYINAILEELKIIHDTHTENYFLIDKKIVQRARELYGGVLTNTGRGSAPSFYVNKLLGFTNIDRVNAPITLFPTRFMSTERILTANSLPDIDLNTADKSPFIKATEDLLGADNCGWMIAWKPLQTSSAFRLYCKAIDMDISEYDEIAKDMAQCEKTKKPIPYWNDKKWSEILKESQRFVGVVETVSESPCSMLLYDKPVRREMGLARTVNKKTKKVKYCVKLDGYNCDKYKYLKNDYLTTTVWAIIRDVCELSGISIPTILELNDLLDEKTFDIYKNGLTCTINQADSNYATPLAKAYAPKSVSEMSSFVAIIRPGCASLLQDFIHRKDYTTGVPELDELLVEGNHRMIYQELIMKYLIWLGIPEAGTYDIIKKISKKKFTAKELTDLKAKLLAGWLKKVGIEDGFIETWTVVEQAAKYSFNASHSLSYAYDSLYGAYLKSHYPLEYYQVVLNKYSDDAERTKKLVAELHCFDIELKPIKFGKSLSGYQMDKNNNAIYKGIGSIKYCNDNIANELMEISKLNISSFVDLIDTILQQTSVNKKQLMILILLNFFSDYGQNGKLYKLFKMYIKYGSRSQIRKDEIRPLNLKESLIRECAGKETENLYQQVDMKKYLKKIDKDLSDKPLSIKRQMEAELEYLEYIDYVNPDIPAYVYFVTDYKVYNKKTRPYITLYQVRTGEIISTKVIDDRSYIECPFEKGSILHIEKFDIKKKSKLINGKWQKTKEEEIVLKNWGVYA